MIEGRCRSLFESGYVSACGLVRCMIYAALLTLCLIYVAIGCPSIRDISCCSLKPNYNPIAASGTKRPQKKRTRDTPGEGTEVDYLAVAGSSQRSRCVEVTRVFCASSILVCDIRATKSVYEPVC